MIFYLVLRIYLFGMGTIPYTKSSEEYTIYNSATYMYVLSTIGLTYPEVISK
jgi:hypothetical protein